MRVAAIRGRARPERPSGGSARGERLPRVYLASALTNAALNARVAEALVAHSVFCFLPQRDAPASDDGRGTAVANAGGILGADVVVALGYRMGKDTAWEVGFAAAHGIPVVLVCADADAPELDLMVFHSTATVLRMGETEVPALLPSLLHRFLTELPAAPPEG